MLLEVSIVLHNSDVSDVSLLQPGCTTTKWRR